MILPHLLAPPLRDLSPDAPVIIAGPTASGKSGLALAIAQSQGGTIINADALQVFDGWRLLTARPSDAELQAAPHALYGHVPFDGSYSLGHWLREVTPFLPGSSRTISSRPIIVGGTGLYLTALTVGLAEIPATQPTVRAEADALSLEAMIKGLDPATAAKIDLANRARVQRAWEVLRTTGEGLAIWQGRTPSPILPLGAAVAVVIDAPPDWLSPRIEQRFDQMLTQGAIEEARAMLPNWDPRHLSSKAIGAPELIAHLKGETDLATARDRAVIASRQYAKRQRTWFRARMRNWAWLPSST
jgi:tRNA dimethylallyltransferase